MANPGDPGYDINAMYTNPAIINLENWNGPADVYSTETEAIPAPIPGQDIDMPNIILMFSAIITSIKRAAGFVWAIGIKLSEVVHRINSMQIGLYTLARRVEVLENIKGGGGGGAGRARGYQNIAQLGSDKSGFRLWHERFINELTQVQPDARTIIKQITTKMDIEETMINTNELLTMAASHPKFNTDKFTTYRYYILMAKCDGDATIKVLTVSSGDGLKAYQEIYKWYTGTSGMAMTKRAENIMNPRTAEDDKDFPELLERWMAALNNLKGQGDMYEMSPPL